MCDQPVYEGDAADRLKFIQVARRLGLRLRDIADLLAEGGRGLPIISALADTTRIVHERSGWVVLRMVKHIVRNPEQP